jgi:hypothetical protein
VAPEEPLRNRSTLLLLLLALGLGAYVYFVERPAREREQQKDTLLDVEADAIEALTLTYPDSEIRLAKDAEGRWRLTAPLDVAADQSVAKNLVEAIASAELTKTIDDPGTDLAAYGLDKPTATVQVVVKGGTEIPALIVGKETPIGFKAYAQKKGDPKLYLTTGAFHSGVKKEVKDLRDKTIVDFQDDQVQRIAITGRERPTVALEKRDGAWRLTEPAEHPADDGEVRSFLSSVRGLRAQDFIDQPDQDLAAYGLAVPKLQVALALAGDTPPPTVAIGDEDASGGPKQLYVKRGDGATIYKAGTWVLSNLEKDAAYFRDKTVLAFAPDDVTTIVVTRRDKEPFTLERPQGGAWSIKGASAAPTPDAVTGFIDDIRQTKPHEIVADGVTDLAAYGLDAPDIHIALAGADGRAIGALLAARRGSPGTAEEGAEEKYYFTREGSTTVFEGRRHLFTRLEKTPDDFTAAKAAETEAPDIAHPEDEEP